ncbi:hypothetical protein JK635_01885 [Neobacillus sp. YIM B02564]|uniref:Uncharacterized protein n=1 Tax=Neobacillus paridis TaxID=2803862 RepID=A0ABS1TIY1_9BACI|nr:hypothetical protein [Neobacillus paridis]MBL4950989.1 hypothetical protein [Neobacillus paridis]
MINKINRDSPLFNSYLEVLKNRIFKIIPLMEENNENITRYIESILFEMYGLQNVINGVKESYNYLSILCGLESILITNKDFKFIRSEIFRLLGLIEKLQKGE